jgi:phenylalanyl-tRNA synthetase beta chain
VRISGEVVGAIGELGPRAIERYGLGGATAVFELRADRLSVLAQLDEPYQPISRFPAVTRDLAWVVGEDVPWAVIERTVRAAGGGLVRSVVFLSVFRSAELGAGRKSVALRMELRAPDRTLSGEQAEACVVAVREALVAATGGSLRA